MSLAATTFSLRVSMVDMLTGYCIGLHKVAQTLTSLCLPLVHLKNERLFSNDRKQI